jgi:uncharacterized protein (DUF2252 family)
VRDAHLGNFDLLGCPARKLVFDIDDFDETLPGPWEYGMSSGWWQVWQ